MYITLCSGEKKQLIFFLENELIIKSITVQKFREGVVHEKVSKCFIVHSCINHH